MDEWPLRSSVEGIDWPAVPEPRASALLGILFQLEQSQWWNPERLRQRQFEQLARLLDHARRSVPFYRERLRAAGLGGRGTPTAEAWADLPLLGRADIQEAGARLHGRRVPPGHGATVEIFTSGSTGRPIRALRTELWELFWSAFTLRDHLWHRRELSGKLATIRESAPGKAAYPSGSTAPNWGRASSPVFATGPAVSLNVTATLTQQAEWLRREDPHYLLTHPTIAEGLARYCLERDIKLPRLRQVETIAEILRPATRTACREAWGVPVVDLYTAREAGYLALQCPEHEHYHVQAEGILLEVLDEAGRPCAPGAVGRVIVTPLHNFAMPLLRYDIGDFAEVGPPCACGRGLPVLRRILGRTQNCLVSPSGEKRWPLLSSNDIDALLAIAPVHQYQVAQTGPDRLVLRVALPRRLTAAEEGRLRAWMQAKFGADFRAEVVRHDELPRGAAGKFQDVVREFDVSGQPAT